ncbi:MAG: 3-dehydroquinate synthase [Candidatus Omnitrophica bacterium]|nr:3-dehydroquinate synthase [Candidatus Omnitrophota bacterium]MDD5660511.1 3-dehydroquinate synthase [Candidatus Omnitrophota bacterium]
MHKITVNLGMRSYKIIVGRNITGQLGKVLKRLNIGSDAFIITNNFLKNKYGAKLAQSLSAAGINFIFKTVLDSEKSKSIETASIVIKDVAKFDRKKKVFIIAFGGGVIGDLAGFVASVYKRGTNYIQVPTTLLAQVDSAIGGKTALDLASGKNLVGAFYQPRLVFSDVEFLKTLDNKQLGSGMAEVIKYAVIKDAKLFTYLETRHKALSSGSAHALMEIIGSCSRIKALITSKDEKESLGLRTILNFGHTIGHAIEAAGGYKRYNHGQAVGLGMIAAVNLSAVLGLIDRKVSERVKDLIELYGLPVKLKNVPLDKIIKAHYYDKKFSGKENKLVLISAIGQAKIVRNVRLDLIKQAVNSIV